MPLWNYWGLYSHAHPLHTEYRYEHDRRHTDIFRELFSCSPVLTKIQQALFLVIKLLGIPSDLVIAKRGGSHVADAGKNSRIIFRRNSKNHWLLFGKDGLDFIHIFFAYAHVERL